MAPPDTHVNFRGRAPQPSFLPKAASNRLSVVPEVFNYRENVHALVPRPPIKTGRDKQSNRPESDISNLDLSETHYGRSGGAVKSAASTAQFRHTPPDSAESNGNSPLGGAVRSVVSFAPLITNRTVCEPETAVYEPGRHEQDPDIYEPARRSSPRLDNSSRGLEQQSVRTTRDGPPAIRNVSNMSSLGEYESRMDHQHSLPPTGIRRQTAADRTIERFQTQIETLENKIDNLLPALDILTETVESLSSNIEMLSATKHISDISGSNLSASSGPYTRRSTVCTTPGMWSPGKLSFENVIPEREVDEIIHDYEHQPRQRQHSTWETDSDSDGSEGMAVSTHASRRSSRVISSQKSSATVDPLRTPTKTSQTVSKPTEKQNTFDDTLREIDSRLPIATKAPQNGVHFAQDNTPKSQQHQHQQEEQQPKVNADAPNAAWYFFYGTLKDPELLRELLELTQTPRLTPARIHGYNVKYFGVYPATVRADVADLAQPGMFAPSVFLDGAAWFVPTAEAAWSLRQHEDKHYKDTAVEIEFKDKPGVLGRMFEWNAEAKLLTDNPAI